MFQTKTDKELFEISLALEPREGSSGTSKWTFTYKLNYNVQNVIS
jgi:hypothetical protein